MADFLVDTDVLLRCLRGVPDTLALTRGLTHEGELHVSALSMFELLAEAHPREEKTTLDFLAPFLHLAINEDIAASAAQLARSEQPSQPALNYAQSIIAATALCHGLTLVTYAELPFSQVPELKIMARST